MNVGFVFTQGFSLSLDVQITKFSAFLYSADNFNWRQGWMEKLTLPRHQASPAILGFSFKFPEFLLKKFAKTRVKAILDCPGNHTLQGLWTLGRHVQLTVNG